MANGERGHQVAHQPILRLRAISLTVLGALLGALVIGGCTATEVPTFDPRTYNSAEQRAADGALPAPRLTPLATTLEATPRVARNATTLPAAFPTTGQSVNLEQGIYLSLHEVLQRSVANSTEVRVAGYDPAINAMRVIEAQARFDPTYFANVRFDRSDSPVPGLGAVSTSSPAFNLLQQSQRADVYTFETGIHQLLPDGAELRASYLLARNDIAPTNFTNPFYENQIRLEVTQPLLREFGNDVNTARIHIAQNDQKISVLDFRKTLEDNLSELEKDYWQLFEAQQEVRIQEELLQRTDRDYSTLYDRWKRGVDPSEIPTRQAESAVQQRKAGLIQAKQHVRDVSLDIKRRMNDPEFPISDGKVILAETAPLSEPVNLGGRDGMGQMRNPELQELIGTALMNRFELGQQVIRINSSAVAQSVAANATLPKLDLTASLGFLGIGAEEGEAFKDQNEYNRFNGSVGFQFEYPIGNREARSVYRRSQLQRLQAIEKYRDLSAQVTVEVMTSLNEIDSTWAQVKVRQQARFVTAIQLQVIEKQEQTTAKFTPEFVNVKLQAESDLANAQREEASALASYNTAIQRLERAKGTLLRYNNILIDEERFGHPER